MFPVNGNMGLELRKAAAAGDFLYIKKYCNSQTINTNSTNGNTSLHWAIKNTHWNIAEYLLNQKSIDIDIKNIQGKTAFDFLIENKELSITIDDLREINTYVQVVVPFGGPNWEKRQYPDQDSPLAATWGKDDPNYYRIDVLEQLFFSIIAPIDKKRILENLSTKDSKIIVRLIHSLLSEVIGVGRCDEQIAVAWSRFLLLNKKGKLEWITGINKESPEGHNFILVNREGSDIKDPKNWRNGLLCDPMARRAEKFDDAQSLLPYLERIILDNNATNRSIDFTTIVELELPLTMEQHQMIFESLGIVYDKFQDFFSRRINDYLITLKSEYPLIKEQQVKIWITSFLEALKEKISTHEKLYNRLKLIKHFEVLNLKKKEPTPSCSFSKS